MRRKPEVMKKIYWLNKEIERLEVKTKKSKSEAEKQYYLSQWWEKIHFLRAMLWFTKNVEQL